MKINPDTVAHGGSLQHDPLRIKSTAFTDDERDALGLRGLFGAVRRLVRIVSGDLRNSCDGI